MNFISNQCFMEWAILGNLKRIYFYFLYFNLKIIFFKSKFIAEGSVRVDIQAQGLISKDVYYVALKNEELNQVSLVLLNK